MTIELDEETVKRAMKKDEDAFVYLYEKLSKRMYTFAMYMLSKQEDAKDVLSDTFLDAWKGIGNLHESGNFTGWIFQILKNKCLMKRREYALDPSDSMESAGEDIGSSGISESVRTEQRVDLFRALNGLSQEERFIVVMNVAGGFSLAEIALDMKLPESTVRSKKSRALAKLKDVLSV